MGTTVKPTTVKSTTVAPTTTPTCPPGYYFCTGQKKCIDNDECWYQEDNCSASETCHNTDGSFVCCNDMQIYDNSLQICKDKTTTTTTTTPIPTTIPSCPSGYYYCTVQKKCIDNDECYYGEDNCSESDTCHNTDGSFVCCSTWETFDELSQSCLIIDPTSASFY